MKLFTTTTTTTTDDGRRLDGYTISSPCEPNGSGELKSRFFHDTVCMMMVMVKLTKAFLLSILTNSVLLLSGNNAGHRSLSHI